MNKTIYVAVQGKIATANKDALYICGNSDFVIEFDFDEEWEAFTAKTARFSYNGSYTDIVFSGTRCAVPVLSNIYGFKVGVFAGDLHTTTPAYVAAKKSILCEHGTPVEPEPDVYAQIMEEMNRMADSVGAEVKARLTALEESDETLADTDKELLDRINNLSKQDTELAEAMEALAERLTAADAAFEAADKAFEAADKALQAADAAFAATDTDLANRTTALENRFKAMDYGEGITLSFGHNVAAKEKGSVITAVPLSWSYGKAEYLVSQELNGVALDLEQRSMTATTWPNEPDRPLEITMDSGTWPTWTIKATDSEGKVVTKSVHNFTFLDRVYYGTAADPRESGGKIDSAFIKSLQNKPLSNGKVSSIKVNAGAGQYIWYCLPQRMGECVFVSGANKLIWDKQSVKLEVTEDYMPDYYVYRSGNTGLGNQTLGVE